MSEGVDQPIDKRQSHIHLGANLILARYIALRYDNDGAAKLIRSMVQVSIAWMLDSCSHPIAQL